jgi:hypothetical protein
VEESVIRGAWLAPSLFAAFVLFTIAAYKNELRAAAGIVLVFGFVVMVLMAVEAGPNVGYHHFRVLGPMGVARPWGFWFGVAIAFTVGKPSEFASLLRRALANWRTWVVVLLTLVSAAKISRPATHSAAEFVGAAAVQLMLLLVVARTAFELSDKSLAGIDARWERLFGPETGPEISADASDAAEPGGPDRFAWTLALASAAVAALLNILVYERAPHVPDEVVYLFHAQYLAAGELWLAPPPVPAAFDLDLMLLDGGKWYCPVPLGWPIVLAVGALVGAPWLVNPLLGGATVLVVYALLRELTSRRLARVGIALVAVSPWFGFLNMSFMTHPLTLLAASAAALGVARSRRTGSVLACAVSGLALGVVTLVRPFDGALVAVLLGLWSIGLGGARLRVPAIAALVVATAIGALATLPYNRALTGDAARFPIQRYVDVVYGPGKNDMGFGPDKGLGWGGLDPWPGHSLGEALVTAQFNLFSVGAELFGWCIGSLVLVWVWLVAAKWRATDRAMAVFTLAVVAGSLLYWFNGGPDFGARYWHLILVPMVWATLRGLRELEARVGAPARVRFGVVLATLVALTTWIPWRALDKYWGYRGMRGTSRDVVAAAELGRELVIVQGERHPDYAALAWLNPTSWDADAPVYAWARDPKTVAELLSAFASRPVRIARPKFSAADPAGNRSRVGLELGGALTARDAWLELARGDAGADWAQDRPNFAENGALEPLGARGDEPGDER